MYESTISAPGSVEIENWITFQTNDTEAGRVSELVFRHELEFGVSDRLQLAIYLADWMYQIDRAERPAGISYSASALEAIYNLTNPVVDPIGASIYQEIRIGDRLIESESKLIAQKNFGPLIIAYNATLEATWEGRDLTEHNGEFQQAFGASCEFSPRFSLGLEMLHEFIFPGWRESETTQNLFLGPNLSLRSGSWFATVTVLAQATNTADEPELELRSIFGIAF